MALHGVCQLAALHETGRTGQLTQRKGEDSDEGLEPDEEKRADEGGVLGAVAAHHIRVSAGIGERTRRGRC